MVEWYYALLEWIAQNPIQAAVVLLVEFVVLHLIYYKTNNSKALKVIFGFFFMPQNAVFNIVGATLLGIDPPREFATTLRMKRWKQRDGLDIPVIGDYVWKWRQAFANGVCRVTNMVDPGHC